MTNLEVSKQVVDQLLNQGVTEVCLCTGARNAPIVQVLEENQLKCHSFFDERSAAFFAIGRARALGRPVVVTCTSGSAVGELLPACIEAFYSKIPLVLLTADRPMSFRGTGSPQSIDQVSFLSEHVEAQYDLEKQVPEIELASGPTHINLCFSEPLLSVDSKCEKSDIVLKESRFLDQSKCPLVVVSGLTLEEAQFVLPALKKLQSPLVLEGTSQLAGHPDLAQRQLPSWRVSSSGFSKYFDGLIRVGSVPTLRLFRDLDQSLWDVPVLQFSSQPWPGLSRLAHQVPDGLQNFPAFVDQSKDHFDEPDAIDELTVSSQEVSMVLSQFPGSELKAVQVLRSMIPEDALVFLGNSLPVREWDAVFVDQIQSHRFVVAQRGVNGIDGLISHFLGMCDPVKENVLILGDLSFMYDSSSLWSLRHIDPEVSLKVIVLNNSGGRIFRQIFTMPSLEMEHNQTMRGLSEAWGISHFEFKASELETMTLDSLPKRSVLEIIPDLTQSDKAWDSLRELYV